MSAEISLTATSTLWFPAIRDISGASERWAKVMRLKSNHPRGISRDLLHAVKSYEMGLPALLPIRKECVLRILIAFKNPSPLPGSSPQTLGPLASILTSTTPRRF
jgi:hypothetical protein